jgi:hypothetical protein
MITWNSIMGFLGNLDWAVMMNAHSFALFLMASISANTATRV